MLLRVCAIKLAYEAKTLTPFSSTLDAETYSTPSAIPKWSPIGSKGFWSVSADVRLTLSKSSPGVDIRSIPYAGPVRSNGRCRIARLAVRSVKFAVRQCDTPG